MDIDDFFTYTSSIRGMHGNFQLFLLMIATTIKCPPPTPKILAIRQIRPLNRFYFSLAMDIFIC
jgi:hypothetical protein